MDFIGARPETEDIIKAAASTATHYITDAYQYLVSPPSDRYRGDRYLHWFGEDDPQRRAHVESVFSKLAETDLTTFAYDCASDADPDGLSYVHPDQFGVIYLGRMFWDLKPTGATSQAGILIRQASRFLTVGSTQDNQDLQENCIELASVDPAQAIKSADNYGYFAENDPPLN